MNTTIALIIDGHLRILQSVQIVSHITLEKQLCHKRMLVASAAAVVALLVATGLGVYKPRGVTPYGWRKQQELRAGLQAADAAT